MSAPDSLAVTAAASTVNPPASPAVLDHGVDHAVDRRLNFVIVVDPAALASLDDPVAGQEARDCETGPDDPPDEEATSDAAGDVPELFAGELELDDAEAAEPEPSVVAVTLSDMAWRRPTILNLGPGDCRYPIGDVETAGEFSIRTQTIFCAESIAPGSQSFCQVHHQLTHATPKSCHALRSEFIARKLSRLAIVAALKRE